jgi:hypothetical protein
MGDKVTGQLLFESTRGSRYIEICNSINGKIIFCSADIIAGYDDLSLLMDRIVEMAWIEGVVDILTEKDKEILKIKDIICE